MKYHEPKIVKNKKAKKQANILFWKVFLIRGGLFFLTSVFAIASALQLSKLVKVNIFQQLLFSLLFVAFFVVTIIVYKKAGKLKEVAYKALFIAVVFWGSMTVLNLFLPVFVSVFIAGALIGLWLEFPTVWIHNILMVLGLAGVASFFGLNFSPAVAMAFLIIASGCDFIATYKTKYAAVAEKEMIEKKVILGFIIPKDYKNFTNKLKQVKPGDNFAIMLGGEVLFSSLLAVSVAPSGFLNAVIIVLFSFIGCLFGYWLFVTQKNVEGKSEPIPALLPVALFAIVGYLVSILIL